MLPRLLPLRSTVYALLLAATLTSAAMAQEEPRLDVIYVPTPQEIVKRMLDMADIRPGDVMIDFGCGDGRMVVEAARRGARGYGVDIDPARITEANENARKAGVADKVEFKVADLFKQDLSGADVMAMYLLPDINLRLRPDILGTMKPGARIVSHAFNMGDWEPDRHDTIAGKDVFLWVVPARIAGTWRVSGGTISGGQRATLTFAQRFQTFGGKAEIDGKIADITGGRLNGAQIVFTIDGQTYTGRVNGDTIEGAGWTATRA
jgi:SAM-dependent methyltransferase